MSVQAVGFSGWDTIPANTLFRITIVEDPPLGVTLFPGALAQHAAAVVGSLHPRVSMIPTTQLNVRREDKATVIDANLKVSMSGDELLRRLDDVGSMWVSIGKVELLKGQAREEATSAAGAEARYIEAQKANKSVLDNAWTKAVANTLGVSLKVALAVIVLVAVVILYDKSR